jgi:putative ABC transport system permease protein
LTIKRGGLETSPQEAIAGGSVEFSFNNSMPIGQGRPILQQDELLARNVIVLGDEPARTLFTNMDPIGEYVRIGSYQFQVIGVFSARGSMFGDNHDNQSWIPLKTFSHIFGDRSVNLTVQAWSAQEFDAAQQQVIEVMRVERGLKPGRSNNFGMWTTEMQQDSFNQMTNSIGIAAFGICAISLLVAGIGIMNIMLVSVTERTREIGLRKALGGTRGSILRQFIIEAIVLSEVGGAFGILMGYSIAIFVNNMLHFPAPVPVWAVTLAIIFCSLVGLGFGIGPAVKAARLDPIEALRYE